MPNQPDRPTYTAFSLNCKWPGFASTQTEVRQGKTKPWSYRLPKLVAAIRDAHASVVIAQELGRDEAAQMAAALGGSWSYQRNGLATVLWSDHWRIEDPDHGNQSRDWQLPAYGQNPIARTLIATRLRHTQTGQYFFAASGHLASNGSWGLANVKAASARYTQAKFIAEKLHTYAAILFCADLNSRGTLPGSARAALKADGWTFLEPDLKNDRHKGIDAVGAKRRVALKTVTVVPLGNASDHDGRRITFQITDPTPKD